MFSRRLEGPVLSEVEGLTMTGTGRLLFRLLMRSSVIQKRDTMTKTLTGKVVLVTGGA